MSFSAQSVIQGSSLTRTNTVDAVYMAQALKNAPLTILVPVKLEDLKVAAKSDTEVLLKYRSGNKDRSYSFNITKNQPIEIKGTNQGLGFSIKNSQINDPYFIDLKTQNRTFIKDLKTIYIQVEGSPSSSSREASSVEKIMAVLNTILNFLPRPNFSH
jgi:hypothetical protein